MASAREPVPSEALWPWSPTRPHWQDDQIRSGSEETL